MTIHKLQYMLFLYLYILQISNNFLHEDSLSTMALYSHQYELIDPCWEAYKQKTNDCSNILVMEVSIPQNCLEKSIYKAQKVGRK